MSGWLGYALAASLIVAPILGAIAFLAGWLGYRMPWLEGIAGYLIVFYFCVILALSVAVALASVFHELTGHRFASKTGDVVGLGSSKEGVPMSWTDDGDGS